MAIIDIGRKPQLTIDEAREIFAREFRARYDIVETQVRSRHFIVKKDNWCGVGVKLKQSTDGTRLVFTPIIPSFWMQFFFGGLFSDLLLRKSWKELEAEVAEFIACEPAFGVGDVPHEQLKAA